jgi:hypothetical protein
MFRLLNVGKGEVGRVEEEEKEEEEKGKEKEEEKGVGRGSRGRGGGGIGALAQGLAFLAVPLVLAEAEEATAALLPRGAELRVSGGIGTGPRLHPDPSGEEAEDHEGGDEVGQEHRGKKVRGFSRRDRRSP